MQCTYSKNNGNFNALHTLSRTIPLDDSAQKVNTTKHQNCSLWGDRNAQLARPIIITKIYKTVESKSVVARVLNRRSKICSCQRWEPLKAPVTINQIQLIAIINSIHVSLLWFRFWCNFFHTFSRVLSVSNYILKSEILISLKCVVLIDKQR